MSTQGGSANRSGTLLERLVGEVLRDRGLAFAPRFRTGLIGVMDECIEVDFYVTRAVDFEQGLYIECRWQDSSGSADKKIAYLDKCIKERYGRPTIVVIDGSCSQAQKDYLLRNLGGHLRAAMTVTEFITFSRSLSSGGAKLAIHREHNPDQKRFC